MRWQIYHNHDCGRGNGKMWQVIDVTLERHANVAEYDRRGNAVIWITNKLREHMRPFLEEIDRCDILQN